MELDKLEIQIQSNSQQAANGVTQLMASLQALQSILNPVAAGMSAVATKLNAATKSLKKVADTCTSIATSDGVRNLSAQLDELGTKTAPAQAGVTALSDSLGALKKEFRGMDSKKTVAGITNLTTVVADLNNNVAPATANVRSLSGALTDMTTGLRSTGKSASATVPQYKSLGNVATGLWVKLKVLPMVFKRIAQGLNTFVDKSNKYVEDINLFNASMGQFADAANDYAQKVADIMGIDPAEWLRNQGVFMTLATGFGIVGDRAAIMSQQLTQLGYDLSSFFNISQNDAMLKLQSGIAGELEPLRRLGYDLSKAKLEAVALSLGIDQSYESMTQAQKAQLRYYTIMKQVTVAQGDMSRTLEAPANQLRIFSAQIEQTARSIGNIFIPMINKFLPYFMGVANVVRRVADIIANLLGFQLPEIDYSGLENTAGAAEEIADEFGDATKAAQKYKNTILGIDEINPLNGTKDTSSGAGGIIGGDNWNWELPTYDFIGDAVEGRFKEIADGLADWLGISKEIDSVWDLLDTRLGGILITAGALVASLGGLKILGLVKSIGEADSALGGLREKAIGITMILSGITLSFSGATAVGGGNAGFMDWVKMALGDLLAVGGSVLVFGTTPVGWTIGIGLALTATITGLAVGWHKAELERDMKSRFGDLALDVEDIRAKAEEITKSDLGVELALYIDTKAATDAAARQLANCVEDLNKLNARINLGLEVSESEYTSAIESFLSSAQNMIDQSKVTAQIALDITYSESETGQRLSEFVNDFYGDLDAQMATLGDKLREVVQEGYKDGEWLPGKKELALQIQQEIQEVLDYVQDVEYRAKIKVLKLDSTGVQYDADTFQKILDEANDLVQEKLDALGEVRLNAIKIAEMEYDQNIAKGMSAQAAKALYDTAVEEAEQAFQNGRLEVSYGTFEFGMDTLMESYDKELKQVSSIMSSSFSDKVKAWAGSTDENTFYQSTSAVVEAYTSSLYAAMGDAAGDPAMQENLSRLLSKLEPSAKQMEDVARSARKTGTAVPENVAKGLNDYNSLRALTGNLDAINYQVGQKLSKDPKWLKTLSTCRNAGADVADAVAIGISGNTKVIEDASGETVGILVNGIRVATVPATRTLSENLRALGVTTIEGFEYGVNKEWAADGKPILTTKKLDAPTQAIADSKAGARSAVSAFVSGFKSAWSANGGATAEWKNSKLPTSGLTMFVNALTSGAKAAKNAKVGMTDEWSSKDGVSSWFKTVKLPTTGLSLVSSAATAATKTMNAFSSTLTSVWREGVEKTWDRLTLDPKSFDVDISISASADPSKRWERTYATGGFPETGEWFIAREAGPEMVGRIGSRTAVANNDQIVAGVASGVSEANSAQNALLREQNELLRALLAKDTSAVISTSSIVDGLNRKNRRDGRTIVPVGV